MSHGFRHKYTRTLAGRCIIPARPPAPSATSSPPLGCLCAAAPRSSAPVRVRIQGWTWPPARFPAARIAPCHFVAAADATCKTNILRFPARDRTAVPFAHWPPARLSVCANTSAWFPPPLQYPSRHSSMEGRFTSRLHCSEGLSILLVENVRAWNLSMHVSSRSWPIENGAFRDLIVTQRIFVLTD